MKDIIQMAKIQLTDTEIKAAIEVLKSGALRQGNVCLEFEKKFAEKVGAEYALTCSSGSAALHLAYMACLKPGDEVLVPSFTFIATASMASIAGMRPVFCDIDPETWLIDLKDAKNRISEKTKAIAPVNLFGNACAEDEIKKFANKYGLNVIWDAAQSHGTTVKRKDVGSFDDIVCYSFYPSKNMFTGEGGMVTTNNFEFAEKIRYLRSHGQTGKYYHTMLGLNYRMTDVEAAIGLHQLFRLDDMLKIRRKNGSIYFDAYKTVEGIIPQRVTKGCEHSFHQFCITVNKNRFGLTRDELASELKKQGVSTGIHYPRGAHQQPIFEELFGKISLPVTESISKQILALPVHHGLTSNQAIYIAEVVSNLRK
ncbi:MAG: DegT/DnrJ/EryC1/StrS family aminotransferase [Desulfobulbaceae bacterium]|nr:DegT/DnrJ/EryC1/StrS family aminotransferase [Desulfobulbaceae bacterium]